MFSALSPTYKGILLALTGYTAFAVADICAKWLAGHYSIYEIICVENALAVVLLLAVSPLLGGTKDIFRKENLKMNLFRAVLNFALASLLTYCYKIFPLADVYTMIFTKPFLVTLLALWFFHERASKAQWLAIIAGFAGVVIAMRPGTAGFDPLLLLPFGSAVLIALLFFSTRFLDRPNAFTAGFFPTLGASVLSIPLTVLTFKMPELVHWPVFILIGVAAAVGMTTVSLAFRTAAASAVAPFLYVEMIWALLFGWLLFGDKPDAWMLVGAAIIILSGIYLLENERRGGKNVLLKDA